LETKNEALEQKQSSLTQAQMEASRLSGELSDMREQLKVLLFIIFEDNFSGYF